MPGTSPDRPEQQDIVVKGQPFAIMRTNDGEIYLSISNLCRALALDGGAQMRRTKRHPDLLAGLRILVIRTPGGDQRTNCLHVTKLEAWLSGIEQNALGEESRQKICIYQSELAEQAYAAFGQGEVKAQNVVVVETSIISSTPSQPQTMDVPAKQVENTENVVLTSTTFQELPTERQRALLANIPRKAPTTQLVVSTFEEDTAFRESCLADEQEWFDHNDVVYFQSSNNIKVYISPPNAPLDLSLAHEQIKKIGISTVLTARIALGLWNSRRYDQRLSENGSTAIALHEILTWRGIKQHTKPATNGSKVRVNDGYLSKYKRQITRDFYYLQQCYLSGEYSRIDTNGRLRRFIVDGPYLRVSVVWEKNLWGENDIVGFLVSPGDWITTHTGMAFGYFGFLDQRIFKLHARYDQLALHLALYLVERWSRQAQHSHDVKDRATYKETITTEELLTASMITFDRQHFPIRFKDRIHRAINKLYEQKILGEPALCVSDDDPQRTWREQWLQSRWTLIPYVDEIERAIPQLEAPTSPKPNAKKRPPRIAKG